MKQDKMVNLMLDIKENNKKMSETLEEMKEHNRKTDKTLEEIKEHNRKTDKTLEEIKEHNKKTDETLEEIKEHNRKTDKTLEEIKEHNKKTDETLEEMKKDISELKTETRSISGSVAVIEHQHGEKIQVLLDGHSGIISKLDSINKRFESDEDRLDNHTFRIAALETQLETKISNQ